MDKSIPAISVPSAASRVAGEGSTYGQILKSSSIIGGGQVINYLISMVRLKCVAILLGPSGVGLVGLYTSVTGLVGTVAGLGIDTSGVREVAEAYASGDAARAARTVKTLRRVCWVTGIFGWLLTAALSYPLSRWAFSSGEHAWAVMILGATLLFGTVSKGQISLIQGMRRISDLARVNVIGAVVSTVIAVGLYAWLGQKGIVPVLMVTAASNLGVSCWFARKIPVMPVALTWPETFSNSKRLLNLGLAFMYGAVLFSIVDLSIRALIVRKLGLEENGIYQAAWAISGLFAAFILNAMGADFYPRLTAAAQDNQLVNRLVNEQIEIGILLALPGLLVTLAFAPWLIHVFYSAKFSAGSQLLPWFVVGVFGQVLTWPLGFIQRAKGRAGWFIISQSQASFLNVSLAMILIPAYGVIAAAWAFVISTWVNIFVAFAIARHLSRFTWTAHAIRLGLNATGMIGFTIITQKYCEGLVKLILSLLIVLVAGLLSLRGITSRLGVEHRAVKLMLKLPGARLLFGL